MSFEATSSASRRRRVMAVAGLAAAATVGGLVFATSAQAVTPTTVTWTAPAQVPNDGSVAEPATIVIDNSAAGTSAITTVEIDVTGPTTLVCTSLTVGGDLPIAFVGANGSCVGTAPEAIAAGAAAVTLNETVTVNQPTLTGTLTSVVHVLNGATTVGTSAAQTTAIVSPTAPAFVAGAVPPATIYHSYTYQLTSTQGFPVVVADTGYAYAFGTHKDPTTGLYSCTTRGTSFGFINNDTVRHYYINLSGNPDSGYLFDVTTGQVRTWGAPDVTNSVRYYTWTLVENNGEGGATAASAGTACGTTSVPTPALIVHDVSAAPFSLPVLFSDVSLSSSFASEIYALSDDQDISGYADGTFRPLHAVSRLGFAAILGRTLDNQTSLSVGDGACSLFHPTAFPDVPNASPFCQEVRDLASLGIINGYSDGKFHPSADISRQALSALLFRANAAALGANVDDAQCTTPVPFNDVTTTNPFCGDIEWMASNGYANGYADGGFHPYANTSRQATAAFIDRIFF